MTQKKPGDGNQWSQIQNHSPDEEDEESEQDESDESDESNDGDDEEVGGSVAPVFDQAYKTGASYLHSNEFRQAAECLNIDFLSRPYDNTLRSMSSSDWCLQLQNGAVIQRPNHNLVHTLRVCSLIPLAARLLLKNSSSSITEMQVRIAQYVMLYAVIGRRSEMSWEDSQKYMQEQRDAGVPSPKIVDLYSEFKKTAQAELNRAFTHHPPASLQLSPTDRAMWIDALDVGKPKIDSLIGCAMSLGHDVDLMRCYTKEKFALVMQRIEKEIGSTCGLFCRYAHNLIVATGDRCLDFSEVRTYDRVLFAKCSSDINYLLEQLGTIEQPYKKEAFSSASSKSGDGDLFDELVQVLSQLSLGELDVSAYDQLKLRHSTKILMFRSNSSCWVCFIYQFDLSHSVLMSMYTRSDFFKSLNLALCNQLSTGHIRMYTQLLSHTLCTMPKHEIPTVVYRGVGYSDELIALYEKHIGSTIYLYNFISTSRLKLQAERFAQKHGAKATILTVHLPTVARQAGAPLAYVAAHSKYPTEEEVLISCNAGYRIDRVDLVGRTIDMTLVDLQNCITERPKKDCPSHKKISTSKAFASGAQ